MAKRGGLGRGLDALIPEKKSGSGDKREKEGKKAKKSGSKSSGKVKAKTPVPEYQPEEDSVAAAGQVTDTESNVYSGIGQNDEEHPKTEGQAAKSDMKAEKQTAESDLKTEEQTIKADLKREEQTSEADSETEIQEAQSAESHAETVRASNAEHTYETARDIPLEETADGWEEGAGKQDVEGKQDSQKKEGEVVLLKLTSVEPNRDQPRKYFDDDAIAELADSIRQFGIIQPLLVQEKDDYYEIIAGERRWRAAQKAGLKEVPAIIKQFSSQEAVEVALIENIQREDLNPIEEAKAFERLVRDYGLSQEAVAGRVSKSRSAIANSMRLLRLDESVQKMVETAQISEGHARAILGVPSRDIQKQMAELIAKEGLSVRQTEKLVRDTMRPSKATQAPAVSVRDTMLLGLAENMKTVLGTKVSIRPTGKTKGRIEIEYYSDEELDRLYELLLSISG